MTILETIIEETKVRLAKAKVMGSIADLQKSPHFNAPTLSLAKALRKPQLTVLAEIKKASPSQGIIRPDFDVVDLAKQYKLGGAAAISVLTEENRFLGSLEYLQKVRRTVDLPLLRKDFIIDEFQLFEARAYGADAVLLIAGVLDKKALTDLHQTATALGLSCLVEVHNEKELDFVDFDVVEILGVNNRDLHTFKVDIQQSLKVFQQVAPSVIRVAESGLKSATDLAYLRKNGIDAVLIGETFMRKPHPKTALATLMTETEALLTV